MAGEPPRALKGTELQDAATKSGFEPSFVALVAVPAGRRLHGRQQLDWTTQLGEAFAGRSQRRLRQHPAPAGEGAAAGKLKTTPQQDVETRTTSSGQQVIVIEPANPQVVYVPQYNPQVVYTQPHRRRSSSRRDNDDSRCGRGGLIGFTAGIAIGAAIDNDYYYGPYGWRGGAYMYNDAWDDWYDEREDAREDWQDHREDIDEERGERARETQEQRTERAQNAQEQRTERTQDAQESVRRAQAERDAPETQAQPDRSAARPAPRAAGQRSQAGARVSAATAQTGRRRRTERHESDAFSGLLEREVGARGQLARPAQPEQLGRRRRRRSRAETLDVAPIVIAACHDALPAQR